MTRFDEVLHSFDYMLTPDKLPALLVNMVVGVCVCALLISILINFMEAKDRP
jgi:hypothetical protein